MLEVPAVPEYILPQNGMRFAAKWNAFCRKMECVLPQNGKRLSTKSVASV